MAPRRIEMIFLLSAKNGWDGEGDELRPLWRSGDVLLSAIGGKKKAGCEL